MVGSTAPLSADSFVAVVESFGVFQFEGRESYRKFFLAAVEFHQDIAFLDELSGLEID